MRILAVDTCAKSCSVAVTDSGCLAGEVFTRLRQTHSRHLMRMVDMTLEISGMTMKEIDAFAVTRGPGSFTGLRIGISAVKGMALAGRKPMIGVSSLQSLAWPMAAPGGLVCAILDAGKGEVYSASYRFPDGLSGGDAASTATRPVNLHDIGREGPSAPRPAGGDFRAVHLCRGRCPRLRREDCGSHGEPGSSPVRRIP